MHISFIRIIEPIKELQKNWLFAIAHKYVVVCTICMVAGIVFFWKQLPPNIPLWYTKPWGSEQLASPYFLFLLPATALFFHIFNTAIAYIFVRDHRVFAQILALTSLFSATILVITTFKVMTLVM